MMNWVNESKKRILRSILKKKIKNIGQNVYIKKRYTITGGKYVVIGNNVSILEGASIYCVDHYNGATYTPKVIIGDGVYANRFLSICCASHVEIGNNTFLGPFVTITDENHGMDPSSSVCFGLQTLITKPVIIGSNCWIGEKVTILPGVSIGDDCVVGAGSVVTKSIPEKCVACGNPARIIKKWSDKESRWITI